MLPKQARKDSILFRVEGTNCAVWLPAENAGLYFPVQLSQMPGFKGEAIVLDVHTPSFASLAEAWEYHLKFAEQAVASQHNALDASFADVLHLLRKKTASLHVMRVINEKEA